MLTCLPDRHTQPALSVLDFLSLSLRPMTYARQPKYGGGSTISIDQRWIVCRVWVNARDVKHLTVGPKYGTQVLVVSTRPRSVV